MTENINSKEYWERRFTEDWVELDGPAQSAYFSRLALAAMPDWLKQHINGDQLTLCDWGCGTGEGTAALHSQLGVPTTGIDFSEEAIGIASKKHVGDGLDFVAEDWLGTSPSAGGQYDVIFSSNTLEHFINPWSVFDEVASRALKHVVLLLPFREEPLKRHEEHFTSFIESSFRVVREGWVLTCARIIDTSRVDSRYWSGSQILVVYSKVSELKHVDSTLAEMGVAGDEAPWLGSARKENEIAGIAGQLGEIKGLQVGLGSYLSDLQRLQGHSHSVTEAGIRALGESLRDSHEALVARMEEQATAKLRGIESELSDKNAELCLLKSELADKDGELGLLKSELADKDGELDLLRSELAAKEGELGLLRSELAEMSCELNQLRVELQSAAESMASRLGAKQHELAEVRKELEHAHAAMHALESNLVKRLEKLQQRNFHLAEVASRYNRIVSSRSWRWMGPLRKLSAVIERRTIEEMPAVPAQQLVPYEAVDVPVQPRVPAMDLPEASDLKTLDDEYVDKDGFDPGVFLSSPGRGLPDVFVWSVIDWHFRTQRPQHIARALAERGHRVFYISNNFINSEEPGFAVEELDSSGRLFQINLHLSGAPAIYFDPASAHQVRQLKASLSRLLGWSRTRSSVSIAHHPYWWPLVRAVPNARLVYDCMDHHAGFETNNSSVLSAEEHLMRGADLVVVTSEYLEREVRAHNQSVAMIRNAGDFAFFNQVPDSVYRDVQGRRVIGYFGAIAEWFDPELVRAVAIDNPDAVVLLIGADSSGTGQVLADLPNVVMTGEVPYRELPHYLHGFDVALLPFKVIPLTLATNPVKIYEYLAAGVPVVTIDLPEIAQFGTHVYKADDAEGFTRSVKLALSESGELRAGRINFAREQTWAARAAAFDKAVSSIPEPLVSVIVLTYNNWAYTRECLRSIEEYSDYPNLEVIVVDNASSDETREELQRWMDEGSCAGHSRRLILNNDNLGFSAGNNIGMQVSKGEYIVILNNDTHVTPGWVRGLLSPLRTNPDVGLVGPVTNNIGNEAKIDITYDSMTDMLELSGEYTRRHAGISFDIDTLAFFCVMMSRATYEKVGPLDEEFGVGFFEDDDYCRRVEKLGLRKLCLEDVFVHHHLSASFDALRAERKKELFLTNKEKYEKKWGQWQPHRGRS
ncbi:glycosyltransferase [Luteimonas sp. e5]